MMEEPWLRKVTVQTRAPAWDLFRKWMVILGLFLLSLNRCTLEVNTSMSNNLLHCELANGQGISLMCELGRYRIAMRLNSATQAEPGASNAATLVQPDASKSAKQARPQTLNSSGRAEPQALNATTPAQPKAQKRKSSHVQGTVPRFRTGVARNAAKSCEYVAFTPESYQHPRMHSSDR